MLTYYDKLEEFKKDIEAHKNVIIIHNGVAEEYKSEDEILIIDLDTQE